MWRCSYQSLALLAKGGQRCQFLWRGPQWGQIDMKKPRRDGRRYLQCASGYALSSARIAPQYAVRLPQLSHTFLLNAFLIVLIKQCSVSLRPQTHHFNIWGQLVVDSPYGRMALHNVTLYCIWYWPRENPCNLLQLLFSLWTEFFLRKYCFF